jgi:hypothetical protein
MRAARAAPRCRASVPGRCPDRPRQSGRPPPASKRGPWVRTMSSPMPLSTFNHLIHYVPKQRKPRVPELSAQRSDTVPRQTQPTPPLVRGTAFRACGLSARRCRWGVGALGCVARACMCVACVRARRACAACVRGVRARRAPSTSRSCLRVLVAYTSATLVAYPKALQMPWGPGLLGMLTVPFLLRDLARVRLRRLTRLRGLRCRLRRGLIPVVAIGCVGLLPRPYALDSAGCRTEAERHARE